MLWETQGVHETSEDLENLQTLLDDSYMGSGAHLRSIITPQRRLSAQQVANKLTGVRVLALATVTNDGRPLVSPVDGLFYRGEWWFGSSAASVRFAHIRSRPQVSATYAAGEEYSVTVHGSAHEMDLTDVANHGFAAYCREVYGPTWDRWATEALYARVDADKMFTFVAPV